MKTLESLPEGIGTRTHYSGNAKKIQLSSILGTFTKHYIGTNSKENNSFLTVW